MFLSTIGMIKSALISKGYCDDKLKQVKHLAQSLGMGNTHLVLFIIIIFYIAVGLTLIKKTGI